MIVCAGNLYKNNVGNSGQRSQSPGRARPHRLRGRGGKMKSVRCLLMGSAAGLMAVSAAQAADAPAAVAPVEYVKVCSMYGAGFWSVPGTDTCMKIGAFARAVYGVGVGSALIPIGTGPDAGAGRNDRTDTSFSTFEGAGVVSFDVRTATEYGTLRSYMNIGSTQSSSGNWPNQPV